MASTPLVWRFTRIITESLPLLYLHKRFTQPLILLHWGRFVCWWHQTLQSCAQPFWCLGFTKRYTSLQSWSEKNRLRFNISKCKVVSITRKSSPLIPSYTLDGKQLTLSNTEMDLGVVLNSNLTWVNQVNSVRYKANKMLGFIRRLTKEIHDVRARKSLYLQLVRNNFAYASQVWSPQTIQLIENIEKVQRRATKYILNLGFTTNVPYTTRLLQLGLLPLSYWHEYLDLVLLYKIINGYTYIDDNAHQQWQVLE